MKDLISNTRTVVLHNCAATASGSNRVCTEGDVGNARNGLLIIAADFAASSDINNICLGVSNTSALVSAGTAYPASDLADIVSDAQNTVDSTGSDVTIASNTIATLDEDGIFVFHVANLKRYVNLQYDGDGSGSKFTAVLVATDLVDAPYAAARTAYT